MWLKMAKAASKWRNESGNVAAWRKLGSIRDNRRGGIGSMASANENGIGIMAQLNRRKANQRRNSGVACDIRRISDENGGKNGEENRREAAYGERLKVKWRQ